MHFIVWLALCGVLWRCAAVFSQPFFEFEEDIEPPEPFNVEEMLATKIAEIMPTKVEMARKFLMSLLAAASGGSSS